MPPTRRSTVWDYSDLRIRADGTRVSSDPTIARAPRYSASSAQDSRGNWIARDAAGKGTVPPYRIIHASNPDSNQDLGEGSGGANKTQKNYLSSDSKDLPSQSKGKHKEKHIETTDAVRDPDFISGTNSLTKRRGERRRRFREDASYLSGRNTRRAPLPTADLLKCIHLFASQHYTVRGQLFDLANQRRRSSKQATLEDGSNRSNGTHVETNEVSAGPVANKADPRREDYIDDMYRMLEGSALMAMGMLVQEYLAKMLTVQPPADWSELVGKQDEEEGEEDQGGGPSGEDESEEDDSEPEDDPMDTGDGQSMLEGLIQMSERASEVMDTIDAF